MKKKLLIAIIALVLIVGLLTACDGLFSPGSQTDDSEPPDLAHDVLIIERQLSDYVIIGVQTQDFTEVTIPDFVTKIERIAFLRCSKLNSITIPNSVKSIGERAFEGCTALSDIIIPDSVTNIGYGAFYDTIWYENQPDGLVYAGKVAYRYKGEMPDNTSITLKDGTLGIANEAFCYCSGLTDITIPDSVTSIGYNAFDDCYELSNVTIGNGVANMGYAVFEDTPWYDNQPDGLVYAGKVAYQYKGEMPYNTSITLKDDTLGIADLAFSECSGLTSITIPDSLKCIGQGAFYCCNGLSDITIPNNVINIGHGAFGGCTGLKKITVKKNNKIYRSQGNCLIETSSKTIILGCNNSVIPTDGSVTNIGDEAFCECCELRSIIIPDSVTHIGEFAFGECSDLSNIVIPKSIDYIGGEAFYGTPWYDNYFDNQPDGLIYIGKVLYDYKGDMTNNISLTPRDDTVCIGGYIFEDGPMLTSVIVPASVINIAEGAFSDCYQLRTVIIDSSNIAKLNYSEMSDDIFLLQFATTVYVKEGLEVGSYISGSFTLAESSDKDGYVKYTRN